MKKIINILTAISLAASLIITAMVASAFRNEVKKVESAKNKTLSLKLDDFYYMTPNDVILGQYALKTGLFAFDNTLSSDGVYNKNWLPLAYNFCQTLKKDDFLRSNDFDNDGIPDTYDKFPYDYSN